MSFGELLVMGGGLAEIIMSALLLIILKFESKIWDIDFKVSWVLTLNRLDLEWEQEPNLTIAIPTNCKMMMEFLRNDHLLTDWFTGKVHDMLSDLKMFIIRIILVVNQL